MGGRLRLRQRRVQTWIVHWDGHAWTTIPSPNPPNASGDLTSISAVSANDIWAVGGSNNTVGNHTTGALVRLPLALHWDGRSWSSVAIPSPDPPDGRHDVQALLLDVATLSHNDAWALGWHMRGAQAGTLSQALMEHWNGHAWGIVDGHSPFAATDLGAFLPVSSNNVWAMGTGADGPGGPRHPLTLHWDGSGWSSASPPVPIGRGIALAPDNTWAGSSPGVAHWDGTAWHPIAIPGAEQLNFSLVTGTGPQDLWASGSSADNLPVFYRYTCAPPPPPVTPTPIATPSPTATPTAVPTVLVPGTGSQTFPETGQTVAGAFLAYWQSHGGLAQQGLPISAILGEVSPLDGQPYTIQYFERAVFEYHPANQPPFDVLLSQLGTFRYHQKYPDGASGQPPTPGRAASCSRRRDTGWAAFLAYWRAHGGLAQQGYPISDEFVENSDLNGQPYLVQYFERAVFEWHPENAGTPYEVLLSQLGTYRYHDLYGTSAPGPAVMSRPASLP